MKAGRVRAYLSAAAKIALGTLLLQPPAMAEDQSFAQWAAAHAIPIPARDDNGDSPDLLALKSLIGTARVVALGEPIHGAHEPMAFRNRLFRFLVEQMGFTAIALESGFTEAGKVDLFVAGGPGNAQDVARAGLTSGFERFIENRDLIQWMRDYNVTAAATGRRKLHFYGIDMSAGAGRISGPRRALDDALVFLSRADPMTAGSIRSWLDNGLPGVADDEVAALPAATLATLDRGITAIGNAMKSNRDGLIARSSPEAYRRALHELAVARQIENYLGLMGRMGPGSGLSDAGPLMGTRDHAMAENVRWAVENEGPGGRLLVFAHDAHVLNWKLAGGIFDAVREPPVMMGSYLRSVYGKDLVIIATSSAWASAQLPAPEPVEDSIDSVLARIGLPALMLDLSTAPENKAAQAWLSKPQALHANLSSHIMITPATAVDAFYFVDRLTPARGAPLAGRLLNEFENHRETMLAFFGVAVLSAVAWGVHQRRQRMVRM